MATAKTFTKHISFDDLAPSLIDDQATIIKNDSHHIGLNNHFLHIPPQFNPVYRNSLTGSQASDELATEENLYSPEEERVSRPPRVESPTYTAPGVPHLYTQMFSPAVHDPSKSYLRSSSNGRSRSESPMFRSMRRTSVRLPPPPNVSVLKKSQKAADEQGPIEDINIGDLDIELEKKMTKMTEKNTQKNSGSRKGYTQAAFANLNEVEDRIETKSMLDLSEGENGENSKKRSKSFAGMTDEELSKLEEFYISKGRSNKSKIDQFDFGEQLPVYLDTTVSKTDSNDIADPLVAIYPSRPTIVHNAISLTIDHPDYQRYVSEIKYKLNCKEKDDDLDLRIVSCYISGRRYTWSSVDWYVENLARDGDHLVIITTIPEFEAKIDTLAYKEKRKHRLERMTSNTSESVTTASHSLAGPDPSSPLSTGLRIEAIRNEARQTCSNILSYYAKRLESKIIRISIEMVKEDSTRSAIISATSLYRPNLQVISTVSANIQIKFRNGKVKLPFFLMKHFAMPAFVVPFEFIKPELLIKPRNDKNENKDDEKVDDLRTKVKKEERLQWLSGLIRRTLENPFTKHKVIDSDDEDDGESHSDESVASINEYFPISPEKKEEMDFFDKMGYLKPKPSRQVLLDDNTLMKYDSSGRKLTPVESRSSKRSSKRSSRIQFNNNGIYKVKSMVDDIYDHDIASTPHIKTALKWDNEDPKLKFTSHPMRKTKSAGLSPRTSSTSSSSRQQKAHHHHHHHNHVSRTKTAESSKSSNSKKGSSSSSTNEHQLKKSEKKKKSKIGSIFKKVFG
ncbi:YGR237C [Saccharomyces arboricola H-6]|uniref:YGR237C n=1 Tax=Saccharomyces arboricola (strain H-6 / AS 2.3317 / CBS 10644) TaxID=1160507 RepID=J8Q7P8_SACAR|nr:YGR237C [Saccharomyces arboricola H-6]